MMGRLSRMKWMGEWDWDGNVEWEGGEYKDLGGQ